MLPLELVEERDRNADVCDHQVAGVRIGGRKDERNLRRSERYCHRRFDRRSLDRGAVGREARRQIDRDDGDTEAVEVGDNRFEEAGQRSAKAGAENRIDDEIAARELREVQLPFLGVGDLDDRHADAAEDLEVRARVAAHFSDAAKQEHRGLDAALHQRARDDEAVAAVVAAAADDADAARSEIVERRLHRRHRLPPGILHQHDRGDADVLDRTAIRFAHLFRVEHSHGPGRAYCLC